MGEVPDHFEKLSAGGVALLFALDGFLDGGAEAVEGGVGVVPRVVERLRVEGAGHGADFGEVEEQGSFGNQEADSELDGGDLGVQVEIDKGAERFVSA